jgi:hypothetical protein
MGHPSGAKQAAGKGLILSEESEKHASGPKGPIDSMPLMPGLKPRPTARTSFSATSKALIDLAGFMYGLKPLPFKTCAGSACR